MTEMDDFIRGYGHAEQYSDSAEDAESAATDSAVTAMADQIAAFSSSERIFGGNNVMVVGDDGSTAVVPDTDAEPADDGEDVSLTRDEIRSMTNGIADSFLRNSARAGYAPTAEEAASAGSMDGWLRRSVAPSAIEPADEWNDPAVAESLAEAMQSLQADDSAANGDGA